MFLLYRFLLRKVGIDRLGIWSVVLATTSTARLSELGLTGSVVKFVAKRIEGNERRGARTVVETAVISIAVFTGTLAVVAYIPLCWILKGLLPHSVAPEGSRLLPYALASLWLGATGGVFVAALDGCLRTDLRATCGALGNVLTLALATILVPKLGLLGLAVTQVSVAAMLGAVSWTLLRRELGGLSLVGLRWDKATFQEMFHYGLNFQAISVVGMLFDPTTKVLLTRYGSLAGVGYYEMASRMIMQFRSLQTAANQAVVPAIAGLQERDPDRVTVVYEAFYRAQVAVSGPLYAAVLAMTPVISLAWIGRDEHLFMLFVVILTMAWFLNSLINPAYFTNLGTGALGWNVVAHAVIGVLNAALGLLLGIWLGAVGVVIGWAAALIVGSTIVVVSFHVKHNIAFSRMLPPESVPFLLLCAVGVAVSWGIYEQLPAGTQVLWLALACGASFITIVTPAVWAHPLVASLRNRPARR
jgi:O-antigen/teichoic acid export membrane protein